MLSLIFKLFCWQQGCRPSMVLFFIEITILLMFLFIFLLVFYILEYCFWRKKMRLLLTCQKEYFKETSSLINTGRISLYSVNSIKTPLTSLRLIIDNLKDPNILKEQNTFNKQLIMADKLLLKIKKREELLNKQLSEKEESRLFNLVEEIQSILAIYQELILINNIKFDFVSEKEYRIFADQDHLLKVLNILLLNCFESLIISKKADKHLKIYFKRTPYILRIYIEDNLGNTDPQATEGLIKINQHRTSDYQYFNLSLYFANQIMKKYFKKGIRIKNFKNKKTIYCLKIKNSFILAEPKFKK